MTVCAADAIHVTFGVYFPPFCARRGHVLGDQQQNAPSTVFVVRSSSEMVLGLLLQSSQFAFPWHLDWDGLRALALTPPPLLSLYASALHSNPVLLSWVLFMLLFHAMGLLFQYLDTSRRLANHKQFNPLPTSPLYGDMLPLVLFNQVFLLFPVMQLCRYANLIMTPIVDAPSTYGHALRSFLLLSTVAPFLHEILFYTAHRFVLHSRWGFSALNHRLHHSSRAHCSISAMYMTPADFFLEVIVPYILPLILLSHGLHGLPRSHAVWMLPIGALGGLYEHSGYNFFRGVRGLDTSVHGRHHTMHGCSFSDGFGSPSVLDHWLLTACPPMPSVGVSQALARMHTH